MKKNHLAFLDAGAEGITAHEQVYRQLKLRILTGDFLPGKVVTLRGLADDLKVGLMPVREAVRRLIAQRALVMHSNRRVSIPEMSEKRQRDIILARSLLEPEVALLAMRHLSKADIKVLINIDIALDKSLANGDIKGYMRDNLEFHFFLYNRADSPVLLGLIESLWLQFGPFIRLIYGRHGTLQLDDQHQRAIEALRQGSATALKSAIAEDIRQGMALIAKEATGAESG